MLLVGGVQVWRRLCWELIVVLFANQVSFIFRMAVGEMCVYRGESSGVYVHLGDELACV